VHWQICGRKTGRITIGALMNTRGLMELVLNIGSLGLTLKFCHDGYYGSNTFMTGPFRQLIIYLRQGLPDAEEIINHSKYRNNIGIRRRKEITIAISE
jgi:hypothetical protein